MAVSAAVSPALCLLTAAHAARVGLGLGLGLASLQRTSRGCTTESNDLGFFLTSTTFIHAHPDGNQAGAGSAAEASRTPQTLKIFE